MVAKVAKASSMPRAKGCQHTRSEHTRPIEADSQSSLEWPDEEAEGLLMTW